MCFNTEVEKMGMGWHGTELGTGWTSVMVGAGGICLSLYIVIILNVCLPVRLWVPEGERLCLYFCIPGECVCLLNKYMDRSVNNNYPIFDNKTKRV